MFKFCQFSHSNDLRSNETLWPYLSYLHAPRKPLVIFSSEDLGHLGNTRVVMCSHELVEGRKNNNLEFDAYQWGAEVSFCDYERALLHLFTITFSQKSKLFSKIFVEKMWTMQNIHFLCIQGSFFPEKSSDNFLKYLDNRWCRNYLMNLIYKSGDKKLFTSVKIFH